MVDPTKLAERCVQNRDWLEALTAQAFSGEEWIVIIAALKFYGANIQRPAKVFRQDGSVLEVSHHAV